MTENEIRDLLFDKHKSDLHSLIVETRQPVALPPDSFPSIAQLLQHRTEAKINRMIENLEALQLDGKEVRLVRDSDSTTRIDLLGSIADSGDLVIIELKKSDQTERQAFTELLGYANHFCTLFPPLSESSLQSILIAPMEGRGVRDALAQELIINDKNILAFMPKIDGEKITLEAYYPSDLYYRWVENNVLEGFMHVLDPAQLDHAGIASIKAAFAPLLQRDILDVADELEQADRQAFDDAVIAAFGLDIDRQRVYDALLSLVEIRQTALA